MDHAATTPVDPNVFQAMLPFFVGDSWGNPSSIHQDGQVAKRAMDAARDTLAGMLNADASELIFTSGGTEANNSALLGAALANNVSSGHVIVSAIEHHSVLHAAKFLNRLGFTTSVLPVDSDGMIDPAMVEHEIRHDTVLISIMHSNNEVGSVQLIREIAEIAHNAGCLMHTDAVQSLGQIPLNVRELGVDLLSMSAHKIYGPKGCGALFVREGVPFEPLLHGGSQERERRAGTENTAAIVGMGEAVRLAACTAIDAPARMSNLRDYMIASILREIPTTRINGSATHRLPNNVNISIDNAAAEPMLLGLDLCGISASSGSACTSGSITPSHVLLAMYGQCDRAANALRFTIGRSTQLSDVDETVAKIVEVYNRLNTRRATRK